MSSLRERYLLTAFQSDPTFLAKLNGAINTLVTSGVIEFLQERGKVKVVDKNTNLDLEAARSFGFNECIDSLVYFREIFLELVAAQPLPPPNYGALESALNNNNLIQEEVDALRANTKPDYAAITRDRSARTKPAN